MPDRTLDFNSLEYQVILAHHNDACQDALVPPTLCNIDGWLPSPVDFNISCEDD